MVCYTAHRAERFVFLLRSLYFVATYFPGIQSEIPYPRGLFVERLGFVSLSHFEAMKIPGAAPPPEGARSDWASVLHSQCITVGTSITSFDIMTVDNWLYRCFGMFLMELERLLLRGLRNLVTTV